MIPDPKKNVQDLEKGPTIVFPVFFTLQALALILVTTCSSKKFYMV